MPDLIGWNMRTIIVMWNCLPILDWIIHSTFLLFHSCLVSVEEEREREKATSLSSLSHYAEKRSENMILWRKTSFQTEPSSLFPFTSNFEQKTITEINGVGMSKPSRVNKRWIMNRESGKQLKRVNPLRTLSSNWFWITLRTHSMPQLSRPSLFCILRFIDIKRKNRVNRPYW